MRKFDARPVATTGQLNAGTAIVKLTGNAL